LLNLQTSHSNPQVTVGGNRITPNPLATHEKSTLWNFHVSIFFWDHQGDQGVEVGGVPGFTIHGRIL